MLTEHISMWNIKILVSLLGSNVSINFLKIRQKTDDWLSSKKCSVWCLCIWFQNAACNCAYLQPCPTRLAHTVHIYYLTGHSYAVGILAWPWLMMLSVIGCNVTCIVAILWSLFNSKPCTVVSNTTFTNALYRHSQHCWQ